MTETSTSIDRQIAIAADLAELGLALAREINRQAVAPDEGQVRLAAEDAALAHDRVARSVRLALLLQKKLAKQDRDKARDRKAALEGVIKRVARQSGEPNFKVLNLTQEARDRLDRDDIYGDVLARPASEIIARICEDLGLSPDWPKLAEEAWAQQELESADVGHPLASLLNPPPSGEGDREAVEGAPRAADCGIRDREDSG